MQPQEPAPGPFPPPEPPHQPDSGVPPQAPEKPQKPRNPRRRLWLAVAAGIVALLCLGGAGVAVLLYDKETKIDRAAPDAVVDNFLRAYLVNRNEEEVALYACKSGGDFAALEAYRTDIQNRESRFSISIQISWEGLRVATNSTQGTVDADLTRAIGDGSEQITDSWRFAVIDEDGWRVCGATKTG
ncbi:hypothetical protein ACGFJ7_06920 [Actinoplanes sp. NPDC048988]|uniref:hypothetical protein n=1 Tax=Actinoplanes sp. NPDC048988 TaxID=3363901 RepID=UPI00371EC7E4